VGNQLGTQPRLNRFSVSVWSSNFSRLFYKSQGRIPSPQPLRLFPACRANPTPRRGPPQLCGPLKSNVALALAPALSPRRRFSENPTGADLSPLNDGFCANWFLPITQPPTISSTEFLYKKVCLAATANFFMMHSLLRRIGPPSRDLGPVGGNSQFEQWKSAPQKSRSAPTIYGRNGSAERRIGLVQKLVRRPDFQVASALALGSSVRPSAVDTGGSPRWVLQNALGKIPFVGCRCRLYRF